METEIESRFVIPDETLFQRLLEVRAIGSYTLEPERTVKLIDEYLDTPGRAIHRQGWACRLREQGRRWQITLKGPKSSRGPVLSRPEIELSLPAGTYDYSLWPQGELRDRVSELTGGLSLRPLVTVRQTRHYRTVLDELRPVAELSLDAVRSRGRGMRHNSNILECELLDSGTPEDLERIDAELMAVYDLIPETRSKLRRALEVVEHGGSPDADLHERLRAVTPLELCHRYGAESSVGDHTSTLALSLFDALVDAHGLGDTERAAVDAAGRLRCLGAADSKSRHLVARDLVARHKLTDMDEFTHGAVAAAVYLTQKRMSPSRIQQVIPDTWPAEARRSALTVAAIVRLAVALDPDGDGKVSLVSVSTEEGAARIVVDGRDADESAERAQKRSDLWSVAQSLRLEWGAVASPEGGVSLVKGTQRRLGINEWDAMPTAARKVLAYWHQQMLSHKDGTREGLDIEELHDMRVAIRRMRSALSLFKGYLTATNAQAVNDRLRHAARVLGAVRDMDVALLKARRYLSDCDPAERPDLTGLLSAWEARRERAQRRVVTFLDGRAYERLEAGVAHLLSLLEGDADWAEGEQSVARTAPRFLYLYYETVRGYEVIMDGAPVELLHSLRIDAKRLRYALEFFSEALPGRVVRLIPLVTQIQDHLGELHDDAVALEMVDTFTSHRARESAKEAAVVYGEACAASLEARVESWPAVWREFTRKRTRQRFDELLDR